MVRQPARGRGCQRAPVHRWHPAVLRRGCVVSSGGRRTVTRPSSHAARGSGGALMFEHLDDPLERERDLVAEYGAVAILAASMRRRRGIVVTTLAISLVMTGGVSGLALGGPDSVHEPVDGGPLLALGDPRSTDTNLTPLSLTGSDRTSPGTCPTAANADRPASSAAVAVAVTDAVVVGTVGGRGTD